jgi:hypothetical protein
MFREGQFRDMDELHRHRKSGLPDLRTKIISDLG